MELKEYMKIKRRVCGGNCYGCILSSGNNGFDIACDRLELDYPEKAEEIVAKWNKEHPQKTILQDFLEKHPNAKLSGRQIPNVCLEDLGYTVPITDCNKILCKDCWNRPLEEVAL